MSDVENCTLSDDEDCCPICQHGDQPFIHKMDEIAQDLTGHACDHHVFKHQIDTYNEEVVRPSKRQKLPYVEITEDHCRRHYKKHKVDVVRQISEDIKLCVKVQENVRKIGLTFKNVETGEVSVNTKFLNEWLKISRHKLDLLKTFKNIRKTQNRAKEMDSYSFN